MKKLVKILSILMIICTLTASMTACNTRRRMPGLTSTEATSSTGVVVDTSYYNEIEGPAFEGSYPAPKLKSGTYTLATQTASETALESNGAVITGLSTTYNYTLNVAANSDGSASVKYTFDRVVITYAQYGAQTITADTNGDCPDYYKDLIGKSFTANIAANGEFKSISGVKELLAANPAFSEKIKMSEASLSSVVRDTYYALPENIDGETVYYINHGEGDNITKVKYRAALLKDNRVAFSFREETEGLPQSLVGAATITNYKTYEPANGTLWVSLNDRSLVEYSSYSKITCSMQYEDETLDVIVTSSGSSKITAK